jgi:hypothetical protein
VKKSLKSANLKAIGTVAILDATVCGALITGYSISLASLTSIALFRMASGPVIVVLALAASSLLPANFKAMLVYWRIRNILPGSRAFSQFVHDPRISIEALKRNVGVFPADPKDQNEKWYKLMKKVDGAPEIIDPHSRFLLFRDLAGLSFLLVILVPLVVLLVRRQVSSAAISLAVFAAQFVLVAVSARFSGERLVTNVLALHSVKKYR